MPRIVPIVEGEGEKEAVPKLCYKILTEIGQYNVRVAVPLVVKGTGNLTKAGGLEKFLNVAAREPDCAAILILIDADDDCALTLAQSLCRRVTSCGVHVPVCVVAAKCEYEAWFLASLDSLRGQSIGGRFILPAELSYAGDVESRRGVKEWLDKVLPKGIVYAPTLDQSPMTSLMDTTEARTKSRSFRRMYHAIEQLSDAIKNSKVIVTPEVE